MRHECDEDLSGPVESLRKEVAAGLVDVSSEEGQGTRFTVLLPAAPRSA